jgi:hypothetical protein
MDSFEILFRYIEKNSSLSLNEDERLTFRKNSDSKKFVKSSIFYRMEMCVNTPVL